MTRALSRLAFALAGSAVISCALAGIAWGDVLELRDGRVIQGQFVGGSPLNIRFRVDGQEQVFATKDVLNIGFSDDSSDSSNASQAPQSPATSSGRRAPPPPPARP